MYWILGLAVISIACEIYGRLFMPDKPGQAPGAGAGYSDDDDDYSADAEGLSVNPTTGNIMGSCGVDSMGIPYGMSDD